MKKPISLAIVGHQQVMTSRWNDKESFAGGGFESPGGFAEIPEAGGASGAAIQRRSDRRRISVGEIQTLDGVGLLARRRIARSPMCTGHLWLGCSCSG